MGSSGSDSLSDYSGHSSIGNSKQGGTSGEDKCGKAFSTSLEEVPNCAFYLNNGAVPAVGIAVTVVFANPRFEIRDNNGMAIGYLPTMYNYLRACMQEGRNYAGFVSSTGLHPLPNVTVDISPI